MTVPTIAQRSALVDSANVDIAHIARLNQQISEIQAGGVSASSLIDARDQAIDDLSSKLALEVSDNGDGTRDVSLKSGQTSRRKIVEIEAPPTDIEQRLVA